MGNTPSQQPFDGDAPETETAAEGPLLGRLRQGLAALADGVRRRLPVPSALEPTETSRGRDDPADTSGRSPTSTSEQTTGANRTDGAAPLPARPVAFTRPARDLNEANPPELEATEADGRLSIHHPDHDDAEITSDTWHPVEP